MKSRKFTYAKVVFPQSADIEFGYSIPEKLREKVLAGCIVSVPFRNSVKTGYVTGLTSVPPPVRVREIQDVVFENPVFTGELIDLAKWMSRYYFSSTGDILHLMLPVKMNRESVDLITPGSKVNRKKNNLSDIENKILDIVNSSEKATPELLRQKIGNRHLYYHIDKLKRHGLINIERVLRSKKVKPKIRLCYRPLISLSANKMDEVFSRSPSQRKIYEFLQGQKSAPRSVLLLKYPGSEGSLKGLLNKGLIEKTSEEVSRIYDSGRDEKDGNLPELTKGQVKVLDGITRTAENGRQYPFLLFGVTGSGKTRVYLELVEKTLTSGRDVIFLLPEIALTTYFLSQLRSMFGDTVAVLHSKMSEGERFDSWRDILSGKRRLIVGPRSAIFAPVKDPGLIIVDEEHDPSYKQHDSSPYYNARDVAVYRGNMSSSVVILGSATPSMESFYNARSGKYTLLELPERISRTPLPEIKLIDLRLDKKLTGKRQIFSKELSEEIKKRLSFDEQVLLMLNRRGYSTFIQCRDCGYIDECSNCKIILTYHKRTRKSVCHMCGFSHKAPRECPECKSIDMIYTGLGTEQVEEAVREAFSGYLSVRMDQDTTRTKSSQRRITTEFELGKTDILLGTQMIAKGFDFSNVNLVGIISADTGLFLPEFRASERTFQLMIQAAGRAGRRKERGLVLIQTCHPDHYALQAVTRHEYTDFYNEESLLREEFDYPPFGRVILLRFLGNDEDRVIKAASETGSFLRRRKYGKYFLGPAPSPIEKIKNLYRWQILLRSGKKGDPNGSIIRKAVTDTREYYNNRPYKRYVNMTIDVDPINLL